MAKTEDESTTDGLEIVSIGTLYDGHWDKKYWSSSRGKDRYAYPVGYHALRTHNGVTYTMEIHEGSAGPVFQITSSDGHSGSGQTPDIAWETFQKKTSRIKLWHTKRYSCKTDGVEFFGFKNTLVQRLLRELLASLDGASEQRFSSVNVKSESLSKEGDTPSAESSKHPDLLSYLATSRITGKASRKRKTTNVYSAQNPDDKENSRKFQINQEDENPAPGSSLSVENAICNGVQDLSPSMNLNCHQDVPVSAAEVSCKSCQRSRGCDDKCYSLQLKGQLLEVKSNLNFSPVNDEHLELDRLSTEVENANPSVASQHKVEELQTINGSDVFEDSETTKNALLYAPDTLDTQQGDTSSPNITRSEEPCKEKDEIAPDNIVACCEQVRESCPEEETKNDSADTFDFDSAGQEVAMSMMAVLLPQALPLFTYTRKKKRKCNPLKESSSTPRTDLDNNQILPVASCAGELAGNSNIDRQKEEGLPHKYPDAAVQNTDISVVPDSIENSICEADLTYQVNLLSDATALVEANFGKHKSGPDEQQMFSTVNCIMESGTCHSRMNLGKETETRIPTEHHDSATAHSEKPTGLECFQNVQSEVVVHQMQEVSCASGAVEGNSAADNSREDYTSMLDSAVDSTSHGRDVPRSMNDYLKSDDTSRIEPRCTEGECRTTFDCDGGRIKYNPLGLLNSSRVPGKEQLISTGAYEPYNSNICKSSSVELFMKNYNGPLSESIICRNIEDCSLVKEEVSSFCNENKDAIADVASSPGTQLCDLLDGKMHGDVTSNKLECCPQVIGCYSHPKRISAVMLKLDADNIYVCTSCGLLEENERDLYLYKVRIKDPSLERRPSFIGHSKIVLPILKDDYGREVAVEKHGLQFTPDARGLVMLDTIQVPYCSERRFSCPCSTCASISFEDNAVKIVQVKQGYVLLLAKFKTIYPVNNVLVCEPDYLVALDESGRLYIWFMDQTWSAAAEEYIIPSYDFVASRVAELKRIPRSATQLLGHNGCGEFSLWDITKRTILSTFSAPASSILEFFPVSLFNWKNGQYYGENEAEKLKDELMAATTTHLTEFNCKRSFSPKEGEDIGIWILAFSSSDSSYQKNPGSWRLGLLVKNMVILGTSFPRSAAIGVFAGRGIIGTDEGLAYMWDLKAGNKVEILHDFKGIPVSHIATDDSAPSLIAVASETGQLWIYMHQ